MIGRLQAERRKKENTALSLWSWDDQRSLLISKL